MSGVVVIGFLHTAIVISKLDLRPPPGGRTRCSAHFWQLAASSVYLLPVAHCRSYVRVLYRVLLLGHAGPRRPPVITAMSTTAAAAMMLPVGHHTRAAVRADSAAAAAGTVAGDWVADGVARARWGDAGDGRAGGRRRARERRVEADRADISKSTNATVLEGRVRSCHSAMSCAMAPVSTKLASWSEVCCVESPTICTMEGSSRSEGTDTAG